MTRQFMSNLYEVEWWPTPTHFAVFAMAAGSANSRARETPEADGAPAFRVQTTHADIASKLAISARTVGRIYADFAAMRVMYSAAHGRRWYIDGRAADPVALERHIAANWQSTQRALRKAERSNVGAPANGVVDAADDVSWLDELLAESAPESDAAAAPAPRPRPQAHRRPRQIDDIARPPKPPSMEVRLVSAIAGASSTIGVDPSLVSEWYRSQWSLDEICAFLDSSDYSTVQEWIEDNLDEIKQHGA